MKKKFAGFLSLTLCLLLVLGVLGEAVLADETVGQTPSVMEEAPAAEVREAPSEAPATPEPTAASEPSVEPTEAPEQTTEAPTDAPTSAPTDVPTSAPTDAPTGAPTDAPTGEPTENPSQEPTPEAPTGTPEAEETPAAEELLVEEPLLLSTGRGSYTVGNSTYTYSSEGGVVTITGYTGTDSSLSIPDTMDGMPVRAIAANVFAGAGMTALTIPGGINTIGADAFKACKSLKTVSINANVGEIGKGAFEGCTALETVSIASGMTVISADAFKGCSKLATVTLPMDTLNTVSASAFSGCSPSLRFNGSVDFLFSLSGGKICIEGYNGSDKTLTIPSTLFGLPVTGIGKAAFSNCDKLQSVSMPASLTDIGDEAFYDCDGLSSLTIPAAVANVGSSAFYGCSALVSVVFEDGVAAIGTKAFGNCVKLTTLVVPDSVMSIAANAFVDCILTQITVKLESNTGFPHSYFVLLGVKIDYETDDESTNFTYNVLSLTDKTAEITGYTGTALHIRLPETISDYTIVAVAANANFAASTVRVTVPGGISQIKSRAFANCASLESVVLESGVTTVDAEAFKDCAGLKEVTLPYGTIKSIAGDAFEGCTAMTSFGGNSNYVFSLGTVGGVERLTLVNYIGSATAVTVPDSIGGKKVTDIGMELYRGSKLTSLTLGANVLTIGAEACMGEKFLASVKLNSGLTTISEDAFKGCTSVTKVILPSSLKLIGEGAFSGTALTEIVIPAKVSSLADDAFDDTALASILVESGNGAYVALDDALFTKDSRELVRYFGAAASYTLPSGIKGIRAAAFSQVNTVTEITLCAGLNAIGDAAFSGLPLKTVYIPDSVTTIADDAFASVDLTKLTVIVDSDSGTPALYCAAKGIHWEVKAAVDPTGVTLKAFSLGVGEVYTVKPTLAPANATTTYTFVSSDPSVLTVNMNNGEVCGRRGGTAVLSVATANGYEASCVVTVRKAPSRVYLSASKRTLGVGESFVLEYALSSGAGGHVTFSSSDKTVATVDAETGEVEGVAAGTAIITAKTYNDRYATCKVTVLKAPTELTLPLDEGTLGVGQTYLLEGTLDNGEGNEALSFSSDNVTVASVASDGTITAKRRGFATITVRAYNAATDEAKLSKEFAVVVVAASTSVSFTAKNVYLGVGQTYLQAAVLPIGTAAGLSYKSSKPSVASVDQTGLITARRAGTAYVAVRTHNGKSAQCKVIVCKAPSKIRLNASSKTLGKGNTFQLKYALPPKTLSEITWASSNETVATVSPSGLITAVGDSGEAVITATTYNGKSASCKVTACAAPHIVTLDELSLELGRGQTYTLSGDVIDANGVDAKSVSTHYSFSSNNSSVVAVSQSGRLKARNVGTATITLSTYNGLSAQCTVKVMNAPGAVAIYCKGIKMNNRTGYMSVGETEILTVVLPGGCGGGYQFASSNSGVVSVGKTTGDLTAKAKGTAIIAVRIYTGKIARCRVRVS